MFFIFPLDRLADSHFSFPEPGSGSKFVSLLAVLLPQSFLESVHKALLIPIHSTVTSLYLKLALGLVRGSLQISYLSFTHTLKVSGKYPHCTDKQTGSKMVNDLFQGATASPCKRPDSKPCRLISKAGAQLPEILPMSDCGHKSCSARALTMSKFNSVKIST